MLISEFSKVTGLNRTTIRFYVKSGLLNPTSSTNGYQHFSQADVIASHFAVVAKFIGLTLSTTIGAIEAARTGTITMEKRIAFQRKQIAVIKKKVRQLQQVQYICEKRLRHYEGHGEQDDDPVVDAFREARLIGNKNDANEAPDELDLAIASLLYLVNAYSASKGNASESVRSKDSNAPE